MTAALAGSALCIALSSCADVTECRAEERDDYPDLESLARSVMAEVPVQNLSRGSYCATTGKTPRASVGVEVRIWDSLDDGFAYLRSWGFTPLEYEAWCRPTVAIGPTCARFRMLATRRDFLAAVRGHQLLAQVARCST